MRARARTPYSEGELDFRAHARPDRTASDLVVGREYLVMGMGFWEGKVWLEIATDGGFLMSVALTEFGAVTGAPSAFWEPRLDPDGSLRLWPPSFYRNGYHSDLADLDEATMADFDEVREQLEAEDRSQLQRGW